MKRMALLPVLLFILLAFPYRHCSAESVMDSGPKDGVPNGGSPPKIQFDEKVHDFGTVYQNKSLKHTFTFRNIGSCLLRIDAQLSMTCLKFVSKRITNRF